jgi:integrase
MRRDKGDGSIFQRADGKWEAWLDVSAGSGRKRKRLKRTRATKQGAKDALADLKLFAARSGQSSSNSVTLGQWLARWLESPTLSIRPTTRRSYEQTIRDHVTPFLGRRRLADLSPPILQDWLHTLSKSGRSAHMVTYARNVLRAALAPAVELGHLTTNPAQMVRVPSVRKRGVIPATLQELTALGKVSPHWFRAWLLVVVGLGLRRGEALGLQWGDIAPDGSIQIARQITDIGLSVPKTESSCRTYHDVPPFVLAALEGQRQRMERLAVKFEMRLPKWIWATSEGSHVSTRNLNRTFYTARREAKVRPTLRIHDLRHTAATTLLSEGADFKSIAQWLGHADARTTMAIYAHSTPRLQAETSQKMQRALGPGSGE